MVVVLVLDLVEVLEVALVVVCMSVAAAAAALQAAAPHPLWVVLSVRVYGSSCMHDWVV